MIQSFIAGFAFYFALAAQLGPQNTFLLRQGIARQHNAAIIAASIFADAVLILIGSLGLGHFLSEHALVLRISKFCGVLFLLWYAGRALRQALHQQGMAISGETAVTDRNKLISAAVAFAWFNPSTLLDLVVLLGVISANYQGATANLFGVGAICASLFWISSIVMTGRLLTRWFAKPSTWVALDITVAIAMLCIAVSLLLS